MEISRKRCSVADKILTPTVSSDVFMDNYFTSLRLLTHLHNIRQTGVLNKNTKMHYYWGQTDAKKGTRYFETRSAHQAKKQCSLLGWLEQQQGGLHSFF